MAVAKAKCNRCGGLLWDTDICNPCRVKEIAAYLADLQAVRALLRIERDLTAWQSQRIAKLESEAALFLEHGLAATEREGKLRDGLQACRKQAEVLGIMRRNNIVIDDWDEPWQKFAFTLYNIILTIDMEADDVLDKTDPTLLHEVPEGLMKSICADLIKLPEADRALSRQLAANQREMSALMGIPRKVLDPTPRGWAKPLLGGARKWHYFIEGLSLCRRWMFLGRDLKQGNDDSSDNCMACRRKLAKLREKESEEQDG